MPAWPPMTGTLTELTSSPLASATNVLARTTSNVVTPNILHTFNHTSTHTKYSTDSVQRGGKHSVDAPYYMITKYHIKF